MSSKDFPLFVSVDLPDWEEYPFDDASKSYLMDSDFWWDVRYSHLTTEERWAWTCVLAYLFKTKEEDASIECALFCRVFHLSEKGLYSCLRKMSALEKIKTDITENSFVAMANRNPSCKIHNYPMAPSKFNKGQYYCQARTDLGFCGEKYYE